MQIEILHCHSREAAYLTAVELRRQLPCHALVEQRGMLVAICTRTPFRERVSAAVVRFRAIGRTIGNAIGFVHKTIDLIASKRGVIS